MINEIFAYSSHALSSEGRAGFSFSFLFLHNLGAYLKDIYIICFSVVWWSNTVLGGRDLEWMYQMNSWNGVGGREEGDQDELPFFMMKQ